MHGLKSNTYSAASAEFFLIVFYSLYILSKNKHRFSLLCPNDCSKIIIINKNKNRQLQLSLETALLASFPGRSRHARKFEGGAK